eukprot:7828794-Alexandrium_andersonii.AAC.1
MSAFASTSASASAFACAFMHACPCALARARAQACACACSCPWARALCLRNVREHVIPGEALLVVRTLRCPSGRRKQAD